MCANNKHDFVFLPSCGADVCMDCDYHKNLVRCYCGWSISGRNGAQELVEMGENIDSDW